VLRVGGVLCYRHPCLVGRLTRLFRNVGVERGARAAAGGGGGARNELGLLETQRKIWKSEENKTLQEPRVSSRTSGGCKEAEQLPPSWPSTKQWHKLKNA